MNRILAVNTEDMGCIVEPGVLRELLNEYLWDTGLFFAIDLGANSSLGGMAATRASGTNAVRYGTMRDNVLALEAVMADGNVIHTSQRAKKSAAGYDLTRLLIGFEGTLGIITKLTLRLAGQPAAISGGIFAFPDINKASQAVIQTIQMGLPVARIELLNGLQAVNSYSNLDLPEVPSNSTGPIAAYKSRRTHSAKSQRITEAALSLGRRNPKIAKRFGARDIRPIGPPWPFVPESSIKHWRRMFAFPYLALQNASSRRNGISRRAGW